jgi:hypothetical protein
MTQYHLAQLNIVKMKYEIDAPELAGFFDRMDDLNALADESPGFVWRLDEEEEDAAAIGYFGSNTLANMSVWESVESLRAYVYRSAHSKVMARRKEWFDRILEAYSVLWWIPACSIPTLDEGGERIDSLRELGPSARAFTFKQVFQPE